MKIRCLVLLVVLSFFAVAFAQFCIPQLPLAYAQGEEDPLGEEEETIQARSNPMESYTKGAAEKSSMQKGTLRKGASKIGVSRSLKTTATKAVSYDGIDGESMPVDPYDAQVGTDGASIPNNPLGDPYGTQAGVEGASMPIDPLGAQAGTSVQSAGSTSWDPSDMPAGWDPFDSEANLDSAEMNH
ncbi:MAG: hypothetical protein ABH954_00250 [Candidatus Omnitrophota bacterium]